jgi:hypothetical protein
MFLALARRFDIAEPLEHDAEVVQRPRNLWVVRPVSRLERP